MYLEELKRSPSVSNHEPPLLGKCSLYYTKTINNASSDMGVIVNLRIFRSFLFSIAANPHLMSQLSSIIASLAPKVKRTNG